MDSIAGVWEAITGSCLCNLICVVQRSSWLLCGALLLSAVSAAGGQVYVCLHAHVGVNMCSILEHPQPCSHPTKPQHRDNPFHAWNSRGCDSPGDDGNSPDTELSSGKNTSGERNYCLKLGLGNISVERVLPAPPGQGFVPSPSLLHA